MPREYSFHLNFFVSTKAHAEAFEGIVTSVKLKQYIHTSFGILSFTHYVLKTNEVELGSNACSMYSIFSQDNDGDCLFLSTDLHSKCHSCLHSFAFPVY